MFKKKIIIYTVAFSLLGAFLAITVLFDQTDQKEPLESKEKPEDSLAEADPHQKSTHAHKHEEHEEQSEEKHLSLTEDQIKQLGIEVRSAGPGQLKMSVSARGRIMIHPDRLAHVLPKLSGVVKEGRKNVGEFVKAGELLAVFESREMAESKAHYLAALSRENLAALLLKKEMQLYSKRISPEQDFLNAKATYEDSHINTQLAKQKLYALGLSSKDLDQLPKSHLDLRLYEIRSPIDGIILDRHLTNGEFVDGLSTIYKIADLRTLWLEIGIYPKDFSKIREGQVVEVINPSDNQTNNQTNLARIVFLSPVMEEETIMARAIAELDNRQGCWCPGALVQVKIETDTLSLPFAVPKEAIQEAEGRYYLFVQTENGFEKKWIQTGRSNDQVVEIIAGLEPAERYVAKQAFILKAEQDKNLVEDDD